MPSKPMTDERAEEVRERHEQYRTGAINQRKRLRIALLAEIPAFLAERDRLKAEVETLKWELHG